MIRANFKFVNINIDAEETPIPPVEVPVEALSAEALAGVIENFILREGTDYGAQEMIHESKVKRVQAQLTSGDVKIVFDPNNETVSLLTKTEWLKLSKGLGLNSDND